MSSDMPRRIQLRRTAGWRKPDNTVVVARPGRWGNPFDDAETYRLWLNGWISGPQLPNRPGHDVIRAELRGKNLACWCAPGGACHADVLLEIANGGDDAK